MSLTDGHNEKDIIASWHKNAVPWSTAVRESRIESRRLVTNRAIVDAVLSRRPGSVLDVGCGEGWLVRALAEHGIRGIGVDVVPALIDQARQAGGGDFRLASYDDIAAGRLDVRVDVLIANFAFLGKESVEGLVARARDLLDTQGSVVIQTLHPVVANGDLPYQDGWRTGSWAGFDDGFTDPAPWYFRTLESWVRLLVASGLQLVEMREPRHPVTQKPASIIFIGQLAG